MTFLFFFFLASFFDVLFLCVFSELSAFEYFNSPSNFCLFSQTEVTLCNLFVDSNFIRQPESNSYHNDYCRSPRSFDHRFDTRDHTRGERSGKGKFPHLHNRINNWGYGFWSVLARERVSFSICVEKRKLEWACARDWDFGALVISASPTWTGI